MVYEDLVDSVLKIGSNSKPKDYWKERAEAPLFCKKPPGEYDGEIKEEDVLTLKVDTRGAQARNPFNALVCASTGVGKSRFVKNLVKAYHKQGFKILYFEPKGIEMLNASKKGKGDFLAPHDINERLPIAAYSPNYIKPYLKKNFPSALKKVKFFSPEIAKLDYPEIWQSFGMPPKAASLIVEMIQKGHVKLEYFERHMPRMHFSTTQAVTTTIESLKATSFFGTKKYLPLEEEWDKGNIVVIPYFSRDGALMNTDVGLVLDAVRDIGLKESKKGLQHVTKKLIVFDDAFYYAGMSATMATKNTNGINLAIRNISNCQNNFRTWGIDTVFIAQSPDSNAIYPALIDGCTTKFVSYIENPMALQGKLPYNAFRLIANTNPRDPMLHIEEESYLFQWVYVKGKTRWTTGYPFSCSVGHS